MIVRCCSWICLLLLCCTHLHPAHPYAAVKPLSIQSEGAGFGIRRIKSTCSLSVARSTSASLDRSLWKGPLRSTSSSLEDGISTVVNDDDDEEEGSGLGAWIPIGSCESLLGLGPTELTVMGQKLVVWHSAPSTEKKKKKKVNPSTLTWSVLQDVCPHRLAPLSQGRVDPETNCIECPYHGWQFESDGTLSNIPQMDPGRDLPTTPAVNAKGLPVHIVGDLIFAFLPSSVHGEMFPQTLLPEDTYAWMSHMDALNKTFFVRDLPYSADILIENFMDPAHIPFAHHGLQGVRTDGSPIQMETLVSNFTHIEVSFKDKIKEKPRDGVLSFQRPCFYHFRTRRNMTDTTDQLHSVYNDYNLNLGIFVVPITAGKTRVFFQSVFSLKLPTWLLHAASNRFLNTDTWLHDAELELRERDVRAENYIYASQSDAATQDYRRWWNKFGMSKAPPNTFGPSPRSSLPQTALTRRQQIDPWVHHSKNCSSCRKNLKQIKSIQVAGLVLALMSTIVGRKRNPVFGTIGVVSGLWLHWFSKRCATAIEGNPFPSGVAERSVSALKE